MLFFLMLTTHSKCFALSLRMFVSCRSRILLRKLNPEVLPSQAEKGFNTSYIFIALFIFKVIIFA